MLSGNFISNLLFKAIQKLSLQQTILSKLLDEHFNHVTEQEKQKKIFSYLNSSLTRNELSKSLLLDLVVKNAASNKLNQGFPPLTAISNDFVGMQIMVEGYFEKDLLKYLGKHVFSKDEIKKGIALDVGAFVGTHSSFMSRYFKNVLSFEPNPTIYKVLEANLKGINATNVITHNFGLGQADEELGYYSFVNSNFGENKFLKKEEELNFTDPNFVKIGNLPIKKGSDAVNKTLSQNNLLENKITLIKIDTQWFELDVLKGLSEIISIHNPIILYESWGLEQTQTLLNFLKSLGYICFFELQEYQPIVPTPVEKAEDRLYSLILASKSAFDFNL